LKQVVLQLVEKARLSVFVDSLVPVLTQAKLQALQAATLEEASTTSGSGQAACGNSPLLRLPR
jgi:hypothetical protein